MCGYAHFKTFWKKRLAYILDFDLSTKRNASRVKRRRSRSLSGVGLNFKGNKLIFKDKEDNNKTNKLIKSKQKMKE